MTPALALDALMRHPRFAEYVEHMRRLAPVGLMDQADAATSDAYRILSAGATAAGADGPPAQTSASAIPDWLRLGLLDAYTSWATSTARSCPHNPDPHRPAPVLAAAWRPGLVVCVECAHLLSLRRNPLADRTCDACGHQCAGPDQGDGIYPGMVQLGPLVYQYGTCAGCKPPDASGNPLSATHSQDLASPRGRGRAKPRTRRGRSRGRGGRR